MTTENGEPPGSCLAIHSDDLFDQGDDAISITSSATGFDDSDAEYEVETILAEDVHPASGQRLYLIKWLGYPMSQCTWEPEENLNGGETRDNWEDRKRRQQEGLEVPFDRQILQDAVRRAIEDKQDRHRRRNAKRKRKGLPLTEPISDDDNAGDEDSGDFNNAPVSEDEASEDPEVVGHEARSFATHRERAAGGRSQTESAPIRAGQNEARVVPRKTGMFTGVMPRQPQPTPVSKSLETRLPTGASLSTTKGLDQAVAKPKSTQTLGPKKTERPSVTGYQGTARTGGTAKTPATKALATTTESKLSVRSRELGANQPAAKKTGSSLAKMGTAKRTGSNIFAEGKTRKARTNLGKIISDTNHDPKIYSLHQTRRRVELASRNKENQGPDPSSLALVPITQFQSARKSSLVDNRDKENSAETRETPLTHKDGIQERPELPRLNTTEKVDGQPPRKKRKSVRFAEDVSEGTCQEPMVIDSDPAVSPVTMPRAPPGRSQLSPLPSRSVSPSTPGSAAPPASAPPTGPASSLARKTVAAKRLNTPDSRPRPGRNVLKKVQFGQSEEVSVVFTGIPKEGPWVADFEREKIFKFRYSCLAHNVGSVSNGLVPPPGPLCEGTITSEGGSLLESVAQHLRSTLVGLYFPNPGFHILVYPSKCEEWHNVFIGQEAAGSAESLKFVVCRPSTECDRLVRPWNLKVQAPQRSSESNQLTAGKMFNWDYNRLLTSKARDSSKGEDHVFFLAFPESRGHVLHALIEWLREHNPFCRIYTSHTAGGWKAFQSADDLLGGTVIVHEEATSTLRRFPNLSNRLQYYHDMYWCFSEPTRSAPLFPSIGPLNVRRAIDDLQLIRLFPYRRAICVTPSFLVSEPRLAYELFKWFCELYGKQITNYKLVTAHDVHEYIFGLLEAKKQEYEEICAKYGENTTQRDKVLNTLGLTPTVIDYYQKTAGFAVELLNLRHQRVGPYSGDEDSCSLIYAPPFFDPNDEQSLVNWFGWWAESRLDQFRKFHVIGSITKSERTMPIPNYATDMASDPDAHLLAADAEAAPVAGPEPFPQPPGKPWAFRSDLFHRESPSLFQQYMADVSFNMPRIKGNFPATLYRMPVSYCSGKMAYEYGDVASDWQVFDKWFGFPWSFEFTHAHPNYHAYIGFFWTIPGKYDPDRLPDRRSSVYQRDPWLVVYRVANQRYRRPGVNNCNLEAVIWDPKAQERYGDGPVVLRSQLIDMQNRLVQMLYERSPEKNPKMSLKRIWMGGFQCPPDCKSPYPIDVTMKFLHVLFRDIWDGSGRILPWQETDMPSRGYKEVVDKVVSQDESLSVASKTAGDPMDVDNDDKGHILFHPPRGRILPAGERSRCINQLHKEAQLARAQNSRATHMKFSFTPTMQWYQAQLAEGRGFEFITITVGERTLEHLGLRTSTTRDDDASSERTSSERLQ